MPRFRFELEGLLKARLMAEEQRQRAVAEIERERLAIEQKLREQQQTITASRDAMRGALTGVLDAHMLRLHAASGLQVMRTAHRLALELAGVHRRLETARASLVEAARDRRAIELLRERRLAAWRQALDKAETDALDELAVIAAARRSRDAVGTTREVGAERKQEI